MAATDRCGSAVAATFPEAHLSGAIAGLPAKATSAVETPAGARWIINFLIG